MTCMCTFTYATLRYIQNTVHNDTAYQKCPILQRNPVKPCKETGKGKYAASAVKEERKPKWTSREKNSITYCTYSVDTYTSLFHLCSGIM